MSDQLPRDLANLSMFNPLGYDDLIELDGPTGSNGWIVNRSGAGWYLHKPGDKLNRHPTIHSIDGMSDFIGAILEYDKAYS